MKRKNVEASMDSEEQEMISHDEGSSLSGSNEAPSDRYRNRWNSIDTLLLRDSPFGNETGSLAIGMFEPGSETKEFITGDECKILVLGAGGLGCELLKDLALSGFKNLTVIDIDTIDVSNLNRQFLFRMKDVGRPKAIVAAEFISSRISNVKVTPYHKKIQDFDSEFYSQFNVIVSGLDNIEARRWMNSMLCSMVEVNDDGEIDPSSIIPFIDGGTEGFKGQSRVILPRITSCFECSLDMFPPQRVFPMCTIADTPRLPEHCISYAHLLLWPQVNPSEEFDADNPTHLKWVYERAFERAEQHKIDGVTYSLTIGVVKNVIPAVASTNAIIAASCALEVFKLISYAGQTLNSYMMYMGATGIYGHTFPIEKKLNCLACGLRQRTITIPSDLTLGKFIEEYLSNGDLRLTKPSITQPSQVLFMQAPPALKEQTALNLVRTMGELCKGCSELTITDPALLDVSLHVTVKFQ